MSDHAPCAHDVVADVPSNVSKTVAVAVEGFVIAVIFTTPWISNPVVGLVVDPPIFHKVPICAFVLPDARNTLSLADSVMDPAVALGVIVALDSIVVVPFVYI